ncbi:GXWXG domain-containing protein [Saccharopolyspora sp. ID03-671]|uniref:GXWXG domain-containing protein n=1 Tax=Saccharopolyspora sp. ID03-671 TaxID=3073066 RepID=UPI00324F1D33
MVDVVGRLRELEAGAAKDGRVRREDVLELFDSLPPVRVEELAGTWRGNGIATGNPFDGLLERFGWYGKRFSGPEDAEPLLFRGKGDRVVSINPAFMPVGLMLGIADKLNSPVVAKLFRLLMPLMTTAKPRARLRMVEYRGVSSAADALPIHDPFRKIDDDTLLCAMDLRGLDAPFLFVLRRDAA